MIGESVHGTETMSQIAYQLIRRHVEENDCRLVLLELSLDRMLLFNRFVQGDESFHIDSLINTFDLDLVSIKQLKELCVWLKEYNQSREDKVWLLGADFYMSSFESVSLCEYVYIVNKTKNDPALKKLHKNIYDALFEGNYTNALHTITESYTSLEHAIGETEAAIVKHCITALASLTTGENHFFSTFVSYE